MKKEARALGMLGLLLMAAGLLLAVVFAHSTWYSFFVVGGTLFFGYVNYERKNQGIFSIFSTRKRNFFKIWGVYILTAIVIEIIGRHFFSLWHYPSFDFAEQLVHVYLIGYPFALFMTYETYVLIYEKIKEYDKAIVLTTIISAFVHEIPNTFAWEWVYTIPYVKYEIAQVNAAVIAGWIILAAFAVFVESVRRKRQNKNVR